jgi:hypothetical protein
MLAMLTCAIPAAHAQVPPAAERYRLTLLREAQGQWGLDAPVAALAAQVHQESGWRADAVSGVGARGMAQFMPATARWWCDFTGVASADCLPHNPAWALRALTGYDLHLFERAPLRFTDYDRLWLALRGYNGGEGNWQAEARIAERGLAPAAGPSQGGRGPLGGQRTTRSGERGGANLLPTREQIDAACGRARRAALHCAENLGYPRRILAVLQPRCAAWGAVWRPSR